MDESTYQVLADKALRRIEDGFKDVDPAVVNTQLPTRQLWLAANARAWHFSYDAGKSQWLDDKGQGVDLFEQIGRIVQDGAGVALKL